MEKEIIIKQEGITRIYKPEEVKTINYILGKSADNMHFTEFELKIMEPIDLSSKNLVEVCKMIWNNKDNPERLKHLDKMLENEFKNGKA